MEEELYWYIEKNVGVTYFEEDLNRDLYNNIGETWEDYKRGCWVPLSSEQISFYQENQNASVKEVWNMQLNPGPSQEELLKIAKTNKINEIIEYDSSENVNNFSINGYNMWLSVEERQQLATQINANEAIGRETMTRWFDGYEFTFPIIVWKQMLVNLEVYCGDAINVTEQHKAAVQNLNNIQEVESFDITADYPTKLIF